MALRAFSVLIRSIVDYVYSLALEYCRTKTLGYIEFHTYEYVYPDDDEIKLYEYSFMRHGALSGRFGTHALCSLDSLTAKALVGCVVPEGCIGLRVPSASSNHACVTRVQLVVCTSNGSAPAG